MASVESGTSRPELRLILDGGMGGELRDNYPEVPDQGKLWSTAYLIHKPDYVVDLHRRYIRAGADVITTNNYSTVPGYLEGMGLMDRLEELVKLSGQLAEKAVDSMRPTTERPILIAGCIPPLQYSYQGEKNIKMEEATLLYEKIATALKPYAHFYICETMSSLDEAIASLTGVSRVADKPIWISLCLQDNEKCLLHSEEPLKEVLTEVLDKFPRILGVSLNCANHFAITKGLDIVMEAVKGRKKVKYIAAYANDRYPLPDKETVIKFTNAFETGVHYQRVLTVEEYRAVVKCWVEKGCNVVGGCCGVGPAYIEDISKQWFPARDAKLISPEK